MLTRNVSLQQTLSSWVDMINNIMTSLPSPSIDRNTAIINFVRSFVSFDIEGNFILLVVVIDTFMLLSSSIMYH